MYHAGMFNLSLGHIGFCNPRLFKSWDYLNATNVYNFDCCMIRLVSQSVKSFKEKLLEKCNLFGAKNCPAFYLKVFYIDSAIDISISIIL